MVLYTAAVLQFVNDLNSKYARILAASQANATFKVGELVSKPNGSAVHMFDVNFDRTSAAGPGVRFAVSNTTAYCGPKSEAATEALDVARQNGPVTQITSSRMAGNDPLVADKGTLSSWLVGALAVAGVCTVSCNSECLGRCCTTANIVSHDGLRERDHLFFTFRGRGHHSSGDCILCVQKEKNGAEHQFIHRQTNCSALFEEW